MGEFLECITSDRTKKLRKKLYSMMLSAPLDMGALVLYSSLFESLENDLVDNVLVYDEQTDNIISSKTVLSKLVASAQTVINNMTLEDIAIEVDKNFKLLKDAVKN
jgi:hypothetical protein